MREAIRLAIELAVMMMFIAGLMMVAYGVSERAQGRPFPAQVTRIG